MNRSMVRRTPLLVLCALAVLAVPAGAEEPPCETPPGLEPGERRTVILAINDVYRIEGLDEGKTGGLARFRTLRKELEKDYPDLLVLHAGDFLAPSFMSRMYYGEQMIDILNRLDGKPGDRDPRMFITIGNHELDQKKWRDASLLARRIQESEFTWLSSNVVFATSSDGKPVIEGDNLVRSAQVESGGIKIGLLGLTLPTQGIEYVKEFGGRLSTARDMSKKLRDAGAEVVVALTHLNAKDDRRLLADLEAAGPDLVVGGHDHTWTKCQACGRWVLKADADARTATVAWLTVGPEGRLRSVHSCFRKLKDPESAPDPEVDKEVKSWQARHAQKFCAKDGKPADCLEEELGKTNDILVAEESEIRSHETGFGDWITEQMLARFEPCKAQVAFVNSGGLRLNQDLAAGAKIRTRHLEELFQYGAPLYLLRIKGSTLQQVAERSIAGWPGSGNWLQIAGFAFQHDIGTKTASKLQIITPDGKRRSVQPNEEILAVTNSYLFDPTGDQDGYTMLSPGLVEQSCTANGTDLKDIVKDRIKKAGNNGIDLPDPATQKRIEQTGTQPAPCMAEETDR